MCIYVHAFYLCVHVYVSIRKSEVNVLCLPQLLSTEPGCLARELLGSAFLSEFWDHRYASLCPALYVGALMLMCT